MASRLFIVHGYMAAPDHHWFNWLKQQAEQAGISVTVPRLPASHTPDPDAWLSALEEDIGRPDEDTWLIGHSLGCITLLNYLTQRHPEAFAGGLLLVAGFSEPVPGLEELSAFTRTPVNGASVICRVKQRAVIASLNDDIVPAEYSLRLSQQLAARFYGLPEHGHFQRSDGVVTFPLAADLLGQFGALKVTTEKISFCNKC